MKIFCCPFPPKYPSIERTTPTYCLKSEVWSSGCPLPARPWNIGYWDLGYRLLREHRATVALDSGLPAARLVINSYPAVYKFPKPYTKPPASCNTPPPPRFPNPFLLFSCISIGGICPCCRCLAASTLLLEYGIAAML